MATKVKPCRIKATGTPQAGYVPKYVDEDTFQWGAGGGGSGDVVVSTDTGNELSTGVALWFGTETDYSSISTPDTNTLYIQYKSDGGGGWQPGVNTIAYYPLNSTNTVNDLSGNGYNFTGSATFGVDEGVDCYQCRSNSNILKNDVSLLYNKSNFTVNLWFFPKSQVNRTQLMFKTGALSTQQQMFIYYISWDNILYASKYFNDESTGYTVSAGQWVNLCATYDGSVWKTYINGNLIYSWTTSLSIPSSGNTSVGYTTYSGNTEYFDGNMSNLIWESATWTAQEVSDYFDLTKGDYGIS